MITRAGRLFHIDFGHFLGNFKSKLGIKRERAPFVFTNAFAAVLDGVESNLFEAFCQLCGTALNILRKEQALLISLFQLMLCCGIPELETEEDIEWLKEKLMLDLTDDEAAAAFRAENLNSMKTTATRLNDAAHILRRG